MKITVLHKDYGWFSQIPVPVTRRENDDLLWCNHDGAIEEDITSQTWSYEREDVIEWTDVVMVCGKCGAYRPINEDFWQEAPIEGVW